MSEVHAKAAEMFAAGESVNAVAKALFKGAWATAKGQYNAWKAAQGGGAGAETAATEEKPKRGRRKADPEPEEEAQPEIWDMTLNVPREKVATLFATFTEDEQATAVMTVLQARMDALLGV